MEKKINVMLVAVATLSVAVADATYDWTGGSATFGDGAVTIVCEAETGHVTSLAANPSEGAITLTGVPMTFADGATVTIASTGTLSFVQKATALGALTLARGDDVYKVWTGSALTEPEGSSMPLAFPGITSSELDFIRVIATSGAAGSGRYEYLSGPNVNGFYTFNKVTASSVYSLRLQMQNKTNMVNGAYQNDIYLRCRTGVRSPRFGLYPGEEDTWAMTGLWEYFTHPARKTMPWGLYGYTTDPDTYGGTYVARISSLGITKVIARRKGAGDGKAFVRFEGGATFGGTTTIAAGTEAVLAVSEGDGAAELSNTINGDGDLTIVPQPATTAYAGSTYREDFISGSAWIVVGTNRSLSAVTKVEGYMQGASHNGVTSGSHDPSLCGTLYSYDPTTETVTVQFQYKRSPNGVKVVNAMLRQNGPNVEIKGIDSGYDANGTYGTWISNGGGKIAGLKDPNLGYVPNNYTETYGIRKLTVTFGGATSRGFATVSGNLVNLSGGKFTVDGGNQSALVTIASINSLPAGGEANVGTNAELRLYATDLNKDDGIARGSVRLVAHDGGLLHQARGWQIRTTQDVVLDGGTLKVDHVDGYVDYLTLSGAIVTNTFPRVAGWDQSQNWHVVGTKPSLIYSGVNIYGTSNAVTAVALNEVFHIDVEDVTGDDAVDCTVTSLRGAAERGDGKTENYAWFMFEKRGPGTLKLTGNGKEVRMPATIGNGTFRFGAGSTMTNDFILAGGNLAAESGSSNALGTLTVNTNATLTVEAGGQLSFASFTAGAGLSPKAVTIEAPLTGNALRFRTGLSAAQLAFFRWRDGEKLWHVRQDEEGYLHPLMLGMVFSVR